MPVTIERHIDDETRARLVALYREAFEPLSAVTATKQTLAAGEFAALLNFDATTVFVSRGRDGAIHGFAVAVTDLKLIPWINPEFFHAKFPEHYTTGRLVYMPCFVVEPALQKGTTFVALTLEIAKYYGPLDAVLAMDCCTYNVEIEHFPTIIGRVSNRVAPITTHQLDSQSFWAFNLSSDQAPNT